MNIFLSLLLERHLDAYNLNTGLYIFNNSRQYVGMVSYGTTINHGILSLQYMVHKVDFGFQRKIKKFGME